MESDLENTQFSDLKYFYSKVVWIGEAHTEPIFSTYVVICLIDLAIFNISNQNNPKF